jgi:hypothetical protein
MLVSLFKPSTLPSTLQALRSSGMATSSVNIVDYYSNEAHCTLFTAVLLKQRMNTRYNTRLSAATARDTCMSTKS